MMKRFFCFLVLSVATLTQQSCDDGDEQRFEDDKEAIRQYLRANGKFNDTYETDEGVFIYMVEEGNVNEERPGWNAIAYVEYRGFLLDGTEFDNSLGIAKDFNLRSTVSGFSLGIQELTKDDRAEIYMPSKLGYGSREVGDIPKNSILVFDAKLKNFQ